MDKDTKIMLNGIEVLDDALYRMDSRFVFSDKEFDHIRLGYTRRSSMDYRWYIEVEGNTVYILRSWNPTIIFKIPFEQVGDKYISSFSYSAFDPNGQNLETTIKKQNHWNFWIYSLITQLIFNEPVLMTLDHLTEKVKIDLNGVHGFAHWRSVYRAGKALSEDADTKVLFYFSVFHDFFRENDHTDTRHGNRAADVIAETLYLHEKVTCTDLEKLKKQMAQLEFALRYHDIPYEEFIELNNPLKNDRTVHICLDADRLDLGRVGIETNEKYLLTKEAREMMKNANTPFTANNANLKKTDITQQILNTLNSSKRQMPAHFTSNGTRSQSFCIDFDISAEDEQSMASQAWGTAPDPSAIRTGEDLMLAAYVAVKLNGEEHLQELQKIIESNDKNSTSKYKEYFQSCLEYGSSIAGTGAASI